MTTKIKTSRRHQQAEIAKRQRQFAFSEVKEASKEQGMLGEHPSFQNKEKFVLFIFDNKDPEKDLKKKKRLFVKVKEENQEEEIFQLGLTKNPNEAFIFDELSFQMWGIVHIQFYKSYEKRFNKITLKPKIKEVEQPSKKAPKKRAPKKTVKE